MVILRNGLIFFLTLISATTFGFELETQRLTEEEAVTLGLWKEAAHTLIKIKDCPSSELYKFKVKRKAINGSTFLTYKKLSSDELKRAENGSFSFIVSSAGYLPAEEIEACMESDQGKKSPIVRFTPFPVEAKSRIDSACIRAELFSAKEPFYRFYFEGFEANEQIEWASHSGHEALERDLRIDGKAAVGYAPAVIGLKGGKGTSIFKRKNGEQLQISLPWLEAMEPYLFNGSSVGLGEYDRFLSGEEKKAIASVIISDSQDLVLSVFHYGIGTGCLEKGEFDKAIMHLEKAVRFEPNACSHQYNLACAYLGSNRNDEAWLPLRNAVLLDPGNTRAAATFYEFYDKLIKPKLSKEKVLQKDVERLLGEPDRIKEKNSGAVWTYGNIELTFKNGTLKKTSR